jgi:drug/metabolite transporter (DMT)-like permease
VPVALLRRPRLPRLADVPLIFVPGVLGISASNLLVSYGQQTISADAAGVLSNTSPIFTALLAFLGERLRPIGWIGIIVAFVGAVMIAGGKDGSFHVDIGGNLVLLAAGVWALYFLGQKTRLQRYGGLDLMTYVIWSGTLALLLLVPAPLSTVKSKSLQRRSPSCILEPFP